MQYCNLATEEAEERARAGEKNGFIDRFEVTAPNSSFILLEGKPKRITHKSQRVSNSFRPSVRQSSQSVWWWWWLFFPPPGHYFGLSAPSLSDYLHGFVDQQQGFAQ